MENQSGESKSSNMNKVILALLILSLIGNIWQWRNQGNTVEMYDVKVDSLVTARVDVEKELTETFPFASDKRLSSRVLIPLYLFSSA